jgi:hypothetical protein
MVFQGDWFKGCGANVVIEVLVIYDESILFSLLSLSLDLALASSLEHLVHFKFLYSKRIEN